MISFMGANFVAQQLGWNMTEGWGQGDTAANDYYAPIETFGERFEGFLAQVKALGFEAVDIWTAQLNWKWATQAHLDTAVAALARAGLPVVSYAGGYGDTEDDLRAACRVAKAIGAPVMGGNCAFLAKDRAAAIAVLKETGIKLGLENHPEKSAAEILEKVGDGANGLIGVAVDTGWWATRGADAAEAIRALDKHVMHMHLKDIRAAGAHETCALGDGIVDIPACLQAMHDIGYRGPISIEHEPETYDPSAETKESLQRLRNWMA